MKTLFLSLISLTLFASDAPIPYKYGVYTPAKASGKIEIVDWNSKEGLKRLESSKYKNDFYQLAGHFQPAINPVFATVASAVIVLNGLRIPKHKVKSQDLIEIKQPKALNNGAILPFPAYSQYTFLNDDTDKIKNKKLIAIQNVTPENENTKEAFAPGIGLEDLKAMLEKVYLVKADITFAKGDSKKGADTFRKTLKRVFVEPNSFVLANFKGIELGAQNEGTVSPLVAYDQKTDSVLILDTGGHKNPWYWVPLNTLYNAMATTYDGGKYTRGYIEISDI